MQRKKSKSRSIREKPDDPIDMMAELLPKLRQAVDIVVDHCTRGVTPKSAALLHLLLVTGHRDKSDHRYLDTFELVDGVEGTFMLDQQRARKIVAEAKKELFILRLIATYDAAKRVYLTDKGLGFASRMSAEARRAVRSALISLDAKQKRTLAMHGPKIVDQLLRTQPTHLHSSPLDETEIGIGDTHKSASRGSVPSSVKQIRSAKR